MSANPDWKEILEKSFSFIDHSEMKEFRPNIILNDRKIGLSTYVYNDYNGNYEKSTKLYVLPFPLGKIFYFDDCEKKIYLTNKIIGMRITVKESFIELRKLLVHHGFVRRGEELSFCFYEKKFKNHTSLISFTKKLHEDFSFLKNNFNVLGFFRKFEYFIDFSDFSEISKKETFRYMLKKEMKQK